MNMLGMTVDRANEGMHPGGPINILLVDDDEGDAILIGEALASERDDLRLHVVKDGVEAMAFLRRERPFVDAPRPALILLDLNMPRKNGYEVMAEVRADPDLRTIPVVILSTSAQDRDVINSYRLQANCFVTKPPSFEQFLHVMHSIRSFWLNVATLPSRA